MTLAVVCVAGFVALVAEALVFSTFLRRMQEAHVKERSHMVAAVLARTPSEYAGLVAAANVGGRDRPAKPKPKKADTDDETSHLDTHPIGL